MAQPTNTFSSYDMEGIREDLQDIIYDISPEETPFYTKCRKVTASATLHEWQTDSLRDSGANAHVEGDDTTADQRSPTRRLGNYTQIFKNAVVIPDTDQGLDKAGRAREIGYQTLKIAKEQKLDIEAALFDNSVKNVGDDVPGNPDPGGPRRLGGVPTWMITNANIGGGTLPPSSNGTEEYVAGTPRAFDQAQFDNVMQAIWQSGGNPDTVYLSAPHMDDALGFIGNNNQRSTVKAESEKVIKHMDMYVTPWGTVEFVPSREIDSQPSSTDPASYVFIAQDDMWKVAVLRPTKNVPLAKTGDSTRRQVTTELTLCAANEASSGIIHDLS